MTLLENQNYQIKLRFPWTFLNSLFLQNVRYNKAGRYVFKPDQLWKTHLKCQQKAEEYCKKHTHVVIVG